MKRYAIADYLTIEEKLRAVEAPYGHCPDSKARGWETPDHRCALGVALGLVMPNENRVAAFAVERGADYDAALQAASEFIFDWDHEVFPPSELPIALGLVAPPVES